MEITHEYLKSIINYNPLTGILINISSGKVLGSKTTAGYLVVSLNYKVYLAHRLAYFIHYGKWPKNIDHDNRIKDDNRIINLKDATKVENGKNCKKSKANTSGVTGVYYFKRDGNWQVKISFDGKNKHLGYFDDIEEAITVRKLAEVKYNYHPNHGK